MNPVIPDASVLLKWVLPPNHEPYVEQALCIRNALLAGDVEILLPSLWYYELGNTLARKYPDHADAILSSLMDMNMECIYPEQAWQAEIVHLVTNFQVTFYDAAYHALAIHRDGVFVTADEKYINKAHSAGHTLHLKDWHSVSSGCSGNGMEISFK